MIATLLATQHSGSYFLGTAIGSHPDVYHLDELEFGEINKFIDETTVLDEVEKRYDNKVKLVSLKYNSVNKETMPLLTKCPVIHLYRNDFKRTYYSYRFQEKRRSDQSGEYKEGTWKPGIAKRNDRTYQDPITADFPWDGSDGKKPFEHMKEGILENRKKFKPYTDLVLVYEELTNNKETHKLPEKYARQICELLKIDYYPMTIELVKKSPTNPFKS